MDLCRAAHVLTTPVICGLTPITADKDILPQDVALITGYNSRISLYEQEIDLLDWFERFPKLIWAPGFIRNRPFAEIIRYRSRPEGVAYFEAMEATRVATDEKTRYESFLAYLKALESYLIATAVDAKADLVPWQELFAKNEVARMQMLEKRKVQATLTAIPVAITLVAHGLWRLVMHTPFPASTDAAALAVNSASPLVAFAASQAMERDPSRRPLPLTRLLAGATRTPILVHAQKVV